MTLLSRNKEAGLSAFLFIFLQNFIVRSVSIVL